MAAWIKMSLGMEVGLGLGDFVLDGDPAPLPKRGTRGNGIPGPLKLLASVPRPHTAFKGTSRLTGGP